MKKFVSASLLLVFVSCSCGAQVDHRIDQQLGRELADRSKNGLGLARFSSKGEKILGLHFFDGRDKKIPLEIDGYLKIISQGRIAILDVDPAIYDKVAEAALQRDSALFLEEYARLWGNIVLLSNAGKVERRSAMSVNASTIAVSHDGKRIAFIGVPQGVSEAEYGIYVGDFANTLTKRLLAFGSDDPRKQSRSVGPVLDWSPKGSTLLFSYRGTITAFDVDAGSAKKIADGDSARWSPSGNQISFAGPKFEAALMELSTGKISVIDPGFGSNGPIEWSPDGKYLLIPESIGSHVPYGCHWIYRISDGAFFPVCDYHMINPPPFWIQYDR